MPNPEQIKPREQAPLAQRAASPEQATVDDAAAALRQMEANPAFAELDTALRHARGLMIFPRASKGDLMAGGAGAAGVLVSRNAEGQWSAPAFYTLRPGITGLHIGFDQATIVVVLMHPKALNSAVNQTLALTTNASVGPGLVGTDVIVPSRDVYTFAGAGSVFLGVTLDGLKVAAKPDRDQQYYGSRNATTANVVLERRFDRPETTVLKEALSRVS